MHLKEYLEANQFSLSALARLLQMTASSVHYYVHAKVLPSEKTRKKIESITGGIVTSEEMKKFYDEHQVKEN